MMKKRSEDAWMEEDILSDTEFFEILAGLWK